MNNYNQLSLENRHQIKALLDAGHNQSEIARTLGVHRSTISRELKRNITNGSSAGKDYCPQQAQTLTDRRHAQKPKHCRLTKELKAQARQWLTHVLANILQTKYNDVRGLYPQNFRQS